MRSTLAREKAMITLIIANMCAGRGGSTADRIARLERMLSRLLGG